MPARKYPSQFIEREKAEGLLRAAIYAVCQGRRFNLFVTINAKASQIKNEYGKFFTDVLKHYHDWQRTGIPGYEPLHVATVEAVGGIHIHCLVRVEPSLFGDPATAANRFRRRFRKWVKRSRGEKLERNAVKVEVVAGLSLRLDQYFERGVRHTLAYMLKGVEPVDYDRFEIAQQHRHPQGPVPTKRTIISVSALGNARRSALEEERWNRTMPCAYVPMPIRRSFYFLQLKRKVPKWMDALC